MKNNNFLNLLLFFSCSIFFSLFWGCGQDQEESELERNRKIPPDEISKQGPIFNPDQGRLTDSGYRLTGFSCGDDLIKPIHETIFLDFSSSLLEIQQNHLILKWGVVDAPDKKLPCGIPPFKCYYQASGYFLPETIHWEGEKIFSLSLEQSATGKFQLLPETIDCHSLKEGSGELKYKEFISEAIFSDYADQTESEKRKIAEKVQIFLDEQKKQIGIQFHQDYFFYRSAFCKSKNLVEKDYPNPIYYFKKYK